MGVAPSMLESGKLVKDAHCQIDSIVFVKFQSESVHFPYLTRAEAPPGGRVVHVEYCV